MHPSAGNYPVLNWIIAYELIWVGLLWSLIELWGGWWMIFVFLNSFNHTTHLFNEPWNCSNHALVVILTKYFLQCRSNHFSANQTWTWALWVNNMHRLVDTKASELDHLRKARHRRTDIIPIMTKVNVPLGFCTIYSHFSLLHWVA